jgi:hypothetical protein
MKLTSLVISYDIFYVQVQMKIIVIIVTYSIKSELK